MKKLYIIAGEVSGDLIGAKLIKSLKTMNPNIEFYGVGGNLMENEGVKSLFSISRIAIMGFIEVLMQAFTLKKLIKATVEDIIKVQPDAIITIDSLGFNKRVVQGVQKHSAVANKIKFIHYVAPTVWAWKPKRAKELAQIYDYLLCLFNFELKYFTKEGLESFAVGHPIVECGIDKGDANIFYKKYNTSNNSTYIALMPGSRLGEVKRLLPIFHESVSIITQKTQGTKNIKVIIPTVPHTKNYIENYCKKNKLNYILTENIADKYNALKASNLAIVASGTVTLELSLINLPIIVAYKVNIFTYYLIKNMVKIKYASIINIILNRMLIKEFLQFDCTAENISKEAIAIIDNNKTYNDENKKNIVSIVNELGYNTYSPSLKAAHIINNILYKNEGQHGRI